MKDLIGIKVNRSQIELSPEIGTILFAEFPTTTLYLDNSSNSLIIKEWADCSDDGKIDRYFYYKTNKLNVARFLKNKITHLDLIRNSTDGLVYFQEESVDGISDFLVISTYKVPTSYLPSSNFVLKKEEIVDFSKLSEFLDLDNIDIDIKVIDLVKDFSEQKRSEIYNLHIKKGEGVGFGVIKTETLGRTLIKFEDFYENVALDVLIGIKRGSVDLKKKQNKAKFIYAYTEVVGSIAASYSLLIRPFQSDLNLFDNLSSSEKIADDTFSLLNNSMNLENLKNEYIRHSEYTISAYKGLLKEIYSMELDLDITWVSDKKELNYLQKIDFNIANKVILDLDSLNSKSDDSFKKNGKFRAINCDTGHFIFISTDEEQFAGCFDKLIREGSEQIVFTKIYQISVQRQIIKDARSEVSQIKDSIVAFYEIK